MTVPAVRITPDLAPVLREIVSSAEGSLLPLSVISDEQLVMAAKAIARDWPIQRIAHQLYTYETKSQGITWARLVELIPELKYKILRLLSGDPAPEERPESLDPVAENAALIRDLRTEYDTWTQKIRDAEAPTKAMMEHTARLGRLLQDAIANHAKIRNNLGSSGQTGNQANQGNTDTQGLPALSAHSEFSAENMQIVFTGLSGNGMTEFLESARTKMEAVAQPSAIHDAETTKIAGKLAAAQKQAKKEIKEANRDPKAANKAAKQITPKSAKKKPTGQTYKQKQLAKQRARNAEKRANKVQVETEGSGDALAETEEA